MSENHQQSVLRLISERNEREEEEDFRQWCDYLLSLPADLEFKPRENFQTDIELQPLRWMNLGIDLIHSSRVTAYVQLANGVQGPPLSRYLPYPVFQMGTEIFLRGMWLCQYSECRAFSASSYVAPETRKEYLEKLGARGLGHDLIKIINQIRKIPQYASEISAMQSLDVVERTIRRYYFPPYDADKRGRWAECRYPKRVYDDTAHEGDADSFHSYPRAEWIETLFRRMEQEADCLWRLRANLHENEVNMERPPTDSRHDEV